MGLLARASAVMLVTGGSGGLLRKMAAYAPNRAPNRAKPVTIKTSSAPGIVQNNGRGLLRRSLLYLQCGESGASGGDALLIVDYTEKIESLARRIEGLEKDYSFFPALFDLLFREFSFEKGALFVHSRYSDDFVPWLARGIDAEAVRSLSFASADWSRTAGEALHKPVRIEDTGTVFRNQSARLARPLFLFPFTSRQVLSGGLLVSGMRLHPQSAASLFECFENMSWKIGDAFSLITDRVEMTDPPARFYYSAAEAVKNFLEDNIDTRDYYYILKIPLTPLFTALLERYRYFNTDRFLETILFVLNAALSHLGAGVRQKGDSLLVFTRGADFFSPELFAHHVTGLLRDCFRGVLDTMPPLRIIKFVEYPACGTIPREMIAEI